MILPSQYFRPPDNLAPERRLMMAILADVIRCIEKYRSHTDARGRRMFVQAKQWLVAEEPSWPYSFQHICDLLDLEANAVRYRLLWAPRPAVAEPPEVAAVASARNRRRKHTATRNRVPAAASARAS
ncbi:MAG: hypothetical protein ABI629_12805 [bacterium]